MLVAVRMMRTQSGVDDIPGQCNLGASSDALRQARMGQCPFGSVSGYPDAAGVQVRSSSLKIQSRSERDHQQTSLGD